MVARVTMNPLIRVKITNRPLTRPTVAPRASAASTATGAATSVDHQPARGDRAEPGEHAHRRFI